MTHEKKRNSIIVLAVVLAVVLVVAILTWTNVLEPFYKLIGIYRETVQEPEVYYYNYSPKGESSIIYANDKIILADESGVSCFDNDGDWQWSKELTLESPVIIEDADTYIVADIGGTGVHGFTNDGFKWTYVFSDKVIGISENTANSTVAVIHDFDTYASAVTLLSYESKAKPVATRKFGKYYMNTASFSENGQTLSFAGITEEEGEVATVLIDMNVEDFEVTQTRTYKEYFYPIINYITGNTLFMAGTSDVRKIAGNNDTSIATVSDGESFTSAGAYEDKFFVTIETQSDGGTHTKVYGTNGNLLYSFDSKANIIGFRMKDDVMALYSDNEIYMYNMHGEYFGAYDGISEISDIEFIGSRTLLVTGSGKMAKVIFK